MVSDVAHTSVRGSFCAEDLQVRHLYDSLQYQGVSSFLPHGGSTDLQICVTDNYVCIVNLLYCTYGIAELIIEMIEEDKRNSSAKNENVDEFVSSSGL